MISVPADIVGQSKHAADWLDGRKEQGPSPVLARAKRQLEELEVDWADAFAVPETESVTVPSPKKKRTEEPAATSHRPPAISASHTAKPPHPPGKVLAQKTADQQLLAQAAHRVQRQALSPPTRLERSLPRRLPTSSCWHRRHTESNVRRNRPRRKRTKQRRRRRKRTKRGRRRRRMRRKRGRRRRGRRRRRKTRRRDGRKQRGRKLKR